MQSPADATTQTVVDTATTAPGGEKTRVKATTTAPVTKKTTKTTAPPPTTRSEPVVLALFGVGFLCLLLAGFGDRIKSIGAAGISVELGEKTEKVAKTIDAKLKSIEGRLNKRATKDDLAKTSVTLARLSDRVAALEKGKPIDELEVREYSRAFIEEMGVPIEVEDMTEPDDAAEVARLQNELDAALAELHQSVEALK